MLKTLPRYNSLHELFSNYGSNELSRKVFLVVNSSCNQLVYNIRESNGILTYSIRLDPTVANLRRALNSTFLLIDEVDLPFPSLNSLQYRVGVPTDLLDTVQLLLLNDLKKHLPTIQTMLARYIDIYELQEEKPCVDCKHVAKKSTAYCSNPTVVAAIPRRPQTRKERMIGGVCERANYWEPKV